MSLQDKDSYTLISIFGDKPGHSVHDIDFYLGTLIQEKLFFKYYIPGFAFECLKRGKGKCEVFDVQNDGSWLSAFKIVSHTGLRVLGMARVYSAMCSA